MGDSVLLIGLGDLGERIAAGIANASWDGELVLAGRDAGKGERLAVLLTTCSRRRVRFRQADAGRPAETEALLRRERPGLIVQCASAVSPWLAFERRDPAAAALAAGGFALQLPAQLHPLAQVMRAVREVGLPAPVVNASYPDLTHPVLATAGLSPTLGIGNAAMILERVRANLLDRSGPVEPVRVLAHHSHLVPAIQGRGMPAGAPGPRVYLGEEGLRDDDLAFAGPPLPLERRLNALAAATAVAIARALLGDGPALRTSAPGAHGLPGGMPVRVDRGEVSFDLPPGLELSEAVEIQWQSARRDGVERVDGDGTVHFTAAAQAAVRALDPALAEPLALAGVASRLRRLISAFGLA